MHDIIKILVDADHYLRCPVDTIARDGEGDVIKLEITFPEKLSSYWVYLDFKMPNGEKFKSPRLDVEGNTATYTVPPYVLIEGKLKMQVLFKNADGATWKSYKKPFTVRPSINAVDDIPDKEDFIAEAQKLLDEIEKGGTATGDAVLYTPQTLTDEQKRQARNNIGAIGGLRGAVLYEVEGQGLNMFEQYNARLNIDACAEPFVFDVYHNEDGVLTSSATWDGLMGKMIGAIHRPLICRYGDMLMPLRYGGHQEGWFGFEHTAGLANWYFEIRKDKNGNTVVSSDHIAPVIKIGDKVYDPDHADVDFTDTINGMIDDKLAQGGGGTGGSVVVDTELDATSGNAVANSAVATEVARIDKEINDISDTVIETETIVENKTEDVAIEWTDGYVGVGGAINSSTTVAYSQRIAVKEGDVLYWTIKDRESYCVCFYSGDSTVKHSYPNYYKGEIVIPEGVDGVIVSAYKNRGYTFIRKDWTDYTVVKSIKGQKKLEADVAKLAGVVRTYDTIESNDIATDIVWSQGYMSVGGGVESSATSLQYSNKIDVSEGDVIYYPNSNYTFRFVTAFASGSAVSASGASDANSYTVPSGIDQIVLSVYVSGYREITHIKNVQKTDARVALPKAGVMQAVGDLNNGDILRLPCHNAKNHNVLVFSANVKTFGSVELAKGGTFAVDSTNIVVTWKENELTRTQTIPHGLTIGKHITVMVQNKEEEGVSLVRVTSNGEEFKHTGYIPVPFSEGQPTVKSVNSVLTDCTLSWTSKNINAPTWVFGDSYLSFYDSRWTYYLAQDGYTKSCLFDGYAGRASDLAFASLSNLLKIKVPNTVVWCLGMNNPEEADMKKYNSWLENHQRLIALQKQYGFELVLYTVPTTPDMKHELKNAIIRESGYRYIDADAALRIDEEGHWIDGALAGDNVHPTVEGAKILYNVILSSVPEIMCNY